MLLRFEKINRPLLKSICGVVIFIFLFFLSQISLLITGIEKKYCSISYYIKVPIYIDLFNIEFKNYYLRNIQADLNKYGVYFKSYNLEGIYYLNFAFDKGIPSKNEIDSLSQKVFNGLSYSYEVALKTQFYYMELNKLYANAKTNVSLSLEQVYNEMIKNSNYRNVFNSNAPPFQIAGPDVRTIEKMQPLFRNLIALIFSFLITLTILVVWISRENEQ
ncbi:MAG: hypothetical protein ACP5QT_05415 [Brevinematia bacterium]